MLTDSSWRIILLLSFRGSTSHLWSALEVDIFQVTLTILLLKANSLGEARNSFCGYWCQILNEKDSSTVGRPIQVKQEKTHTTQEGPIQRNLFKWRVLKIKRLTAPFPASTRWRMLDFLHASHLCLHAGSSQASKCGIWGNVFESRSSSVNKLALMHVKILNMVDMVMTKAWREVFVAWPLRWDFITLCFMCLLFVFNRDEMCDAHHTPPASQSHCLIPVSKLLGACSFSSCSAVQSIDCSPVWRFDGALHRSMASPLHDEALLTRHACRVWAASNIPA